MTPTEFLEKVWPQQGPYLLAVPAKWVDNETGKDKSGYRHIVCNNIEDAGNRARLLATDREDPKDVYYAMGTIKSVPEKGMKGVRLQSNINEVRAFWLDLDTGEDKQYKDLADAASNLRQLCQTFKLPKPYVVCSGHGLHVYWVMDTAIPAHRWSLVAAKFKAWLAVNRFQTDTSRTADCASVLRVPGTWNFKNPQNPAQVRVLAAGQVVPTEKFCAYLEALYETVKDQVATMDRPGRIPTTTIEGARPDTAGSDINKDAMAGTIADGPPPKTDRVVKGCRQLLWQAKNQEKVSEPSWYDMLGVMRFTEAGVKACHALSAKHPGYSAGDTTDKINQHKDGGFGPTRCSTIEGHNPGGCDGCPHKGKIASPIVLGMTMRDVKAPEYVDPKTEVKHEIPPPPAPFKRVLHEETQEIVVAMEIEASEDRVIDQVIYEHDVYPVAIVYSERAREYVVRIRRFLPKDGWGEFEIPMGSLYDPRRLSVTMGNLGVMPDVANVQFLVQYMIAYIRTLQRQQAATTEYSQLGWREDRFVLPESEVLPEGVNRIAPAKNTSNALKWETAKGDIEEWKKVPAMYAKPGLESLQFGIMVGFAAPLFKFTNYNGVVVSLVGKRGCGKSSVAQVANSIWGHQKMGWVDLQKDSWKGFYNKIGTLNNLPVTYDEVTNLPERDLSDLCYAISKGTGRQVLNQDGTAKELDNNWQTMMISTSNSSLHSRLSLAKADASAESVRVFEYYVPSGTIPKVQADDTLMLLNDHFGLAGAPYMHFVVQHKEKVMERVVHWMREVEKRAGVTSGERFWSAAPAAVLAATEITNTMQLTNYDIPAMFEFVVKAINTMRGSVESTTSTPTMSLVSYLNQAVSGAVILTTEPQPNRPPLVAHMPRSTLRLRVEQWHKKLFIDRADLYRYCSDNHVDIRAMQEGLAQTGVLLHSNFKQSLGKHTAMATGQAPCWVIDLGHSDMDGMIDDAVKDVVSQAIENAREQR